MVSCSRVSVNPIYQVSLHNLGQIAAEGSVRNHLTGGFLCAVLDLSGILCSLLIPEYSGINRRSEPLPGSEVISTLFLFMNHMVKVIIYNPLSFMVDLMFL